MSSRDDDSVFECRVRSALRKDLVRRRMGKVLVRSVQDGCTRDDIVSVVDEYFAREVLSE